MFLDVLDMSIFFISFYLVHTCKPAGLQSFESLLFTFGVTMAVIGMYGVSKTILENLVA